MEDVGDGIGEGVDKGGKSAVDLEETQSKSVNSRGQKSWFVPGSLARWRLGRRAWASLLGLVAVHGAVIGGAAEHALVGGSCMPSSRETRPIRERGALLSR